VHISPATGVLPRMADTSELVGGELSFATRVITNVAAPLVPDDPVGPTVPL